MTFKAAEVLERADVVFCFDWSKADLVSRTRRGVLEVASRTLVGGQYCGCNPADYEGETRQRVEAANAEFQKLSARVRQLVAAGKTVAFAADGDPTLYSPWGWITEQFANLNPAVVPGLSLVQRRQRRAGAWGRRAELRAHLQRDRPGNARLPRPPGQHRGPIHPHEQAGRPARATAPISRRYSAGRRVRGELPDGESDPSHVGHGPRRTGQGTLPHLYLLYVGDGLNRKHNSPDAPQ